MFCHPNRMDSAKCRIAGSRDSEVEFRQRPALVAAAEKAQCRSMSAKITRPALPRCALRSVLSVVSCSVTRALYGLISPCQAVRDAPA